MKDNWQSKKLGDVIKLEYGKPLPDSKRSKIGAYPAYGANGEKDRTNEYYYDKKSVIVGRKGSAGEINLTEEKFWPLDVTYYVTFDDKEYDLKYLYYLLSNLGLPKLAKGVKPGINRNEVYSIDVFVPPLSEQQRIVSILDESFAAIAKAKENTEKNLQNARELFDSYLQAVFAEAWQTSQLVTLSDLTTDITDGDHMPPPKSPTGVPFITIGNIVKETREIDFTNTFKVSHAYFNSLKANRKPKKGDVLYTVTGSFGIPVLVNGNSEFCFQRHIGLIRPMPETNSAWLYYLLLSPQVFKQADAGATGTAQRTVSLKLLRSLVVPRVTPEQQYVVVAKFDALSAETQRLESIYQQKLAALEELKKSILQKAFSGELIVGSKLTMLHFIQQEMVWA